MIGRWIRGLATCEVAEAERETPQRFCAPIPPHPLMIHLNGCCSNCLKKALAFLVGTFAVLLFVCGAFDSDLTVVPPTQPMERVGSANRRNRIRTCTHLSLAATHGNCAIAKQDIHHLKVDDPLQAFAQ